MGKAKAVADYTSELTSHYGYTLTVTAESTKGSTARVSINGTQAAAGVSMSTPDKINPSKDQCGDMANTAEELAQGHSAAKKMSGGDIYSIGN